MTRSRELKGWHVLVMLIAFFSAIVAANAVFVTLAVRSFPGQEAAKPYMQGLHYNDEVEKRLAEAELGWTASVESVARRPDGASLLLEVRNRAGQKLHGLRIEGELRRPTHAGEDRAVAFSTSGGGAYVGIVEGAGPGLWDLKGVATSSDGQSFRIETRVVLP